MDFPFVGPSYVARSATVDAERSINLYPEAVESENGKAKYVLIGSPGKTLLNALPGILYRGAHVVRGVTDRVFCVLDGSLYEIFSNGSYQVRGNLRTTVGYVSMDNNNVSQLCLVDGANGYIFNLTTNVFSQISATGFIGGDQVTFVDNYFATNQPGTPNWGLSALSDGTSWDGLDHAAKEGSPDNLVALCTLHRQLYFLGQKTSEVWYDTGANTFPFAPIPGVFIEKGIASAFSLRKLDNTIFWIGLDDNGSLVVYRMNGYIPERISTHAIELLLKTFGDPSKFVCYTYQEEGHDFYVINGAANNTTVVYDPSTKFWHERQSFDETNVRNRDRANFHVFAFGMHLLFDYNNGNLYTSSLDIYTSNNKPHPRIRICPHPKADLKYVFYKSFQVDMETGIGSDGGSGGSNPVALLKQSNDGGKTWGNERYVSIGALGNNKTRARWTQLGRSRDKVFWFEIDDPVKVVLIASQVSVALGAT